MTIWYISMKIHTVAEQQPSQQKQTNKQTNKHKHNNNNKNTSRCNRPRQKEKHAEDTAAIKLTSRLTLSTGEREGRWAACTSNSREASHPCFAARCTGVFPTYSNGKMKRCVRTSKRECNTNDTHTHTHTYIYIYIYMYICIYTLSKLK